MSFANNEFFLGGISQQGFKTHFNKEIEKPDYFTYILKGGAGTGKSTLLKRIATEFSDKDEVVVYYCSSDPNSLDAVLLKNAGIIVVDGTAPHVFDPIYAGVAQKILNLGEFWDDVVLEENYEEIINVTNENLKWHKRCRNFVSALTSLYADTYTIGQEALNSKKLDAFIERLSAKVLPKSKNIDDGKTEFAQLSALTPDGYITLLNTIKDYKNVFILNDSYFAGSDLMLRDFATVATMKGYDVVISECTLFSPDVYEHLLIPSLSTAFISSTPINSNQIENAKIINFQRFYDKAAIAQKKQRLAFNKKASDEIIAEAILALSNAKKIHDDIEAYYIKAMDYEKVNSLCDKLINEIKKMY
jgi:hypothetical protein